MQDSHLFEYAIVRVVPKVEREEFLNVGVILYCKKHKFLQTAFALDEARLCAFANGIDLNEIKNHLTAFQQIALGTLDGGPIGKLDMVSRFRWLTATRSTIIQSSKVHSGLCEDPSVMLAKLFQEMVS